MTPLVQELYSGMTRTPVAMIPNGFDEEDFAGEAPAGDGCFNITHTGLFARDGNPFTLWKVLGAKASADPAFKEALRLRLVGKVDAEVLQAIEDAGLGGNVVSLGYKAHPEAVAEQRSASVLVLPLRNDPDYMLILPGKLFEYLGARRPILGIGQTDGAMARIVGETRTGEVYDWPDAAGLRAAVDRLWVAFRSGEEPALTENIEAYSRRSTARRMAALMEELATK